MKYMKTYLFLILSVLVSCGNNKKSQDLIDNRLRGDWFLDFAKTNEAIAQNRGVAPESLAKTLFDVFSRSQHITFDQDNGLMVIGSKSGDADTHPYLIKKRGSTFLILEVMGGNDFQQELLVRFLGENQDIMWIEAGKFDMKCYHKLP